MYMMQLNIIAFLQNVPRNHDSNSSSDMSFKCKLNRNFLTFTRVQKTLTGNKMLKEIYFISFLYEFKPYYRSKYYIY